MTSPITIKRKIVKIGNSEYIALPKAWLKTRRSQGILETDNQGFEVLTIDIGEELTIKTLIKGGRISMI